MSIMLDGFSIALALVQSAVVPAPVFPERIEAAQPLPILPESVRAMIDTAIKSGDPKTVTTVFAIARKTHPEAAPEIDALSAAWHALQTEEKLRQAREERERLANLDFFDNWKGQVEFGASRSTGNTSNLGIYGAVKAERKGLEWTHKFNARADIQRTNGVTTTQRVLASWQPNYAMEDRLYAFGLAQYEHDRFLGYENRYTLGGGLGYGIVATDDMTLDFEGGPAFRLTDFVTGETDPTLAGRASVDFAWAITPTLKFNQTGALYIESDDGSATSSTAIDTKLLESLKARLSYNVQYERDTPPGVDPVDTISRATLIYSF